MQHSYFGGKRVISVDGVMIVNERKVVDFGTRHPFSIGGHHCTVVISTNGFTYNYDLLVDGQSMRSERQTAESGPAPWWGWLFIVACALIPVVSLGGILPAAVGLTGAIQCYQISRNRNRSLGSRIALCLGITLLAWALLGAVIYGTAELLTRLR